VHLYGHIYEVATFRSDREYLDGRHPSSVTFSGPEQDALRRDFTINGLFYDPVADRLIDYVHGRNDIQNRLIRTIGDPHARFTEDKLRMLRAIRLACSLDFRIAPKTWSAIQFFAADVLQVSWERIRDELVQILTGPGPGPGLDLLHESGLLLHVLPEVEAMRGIMPSVENPTGMDVFAHTRAALTMLRKPSVALAVATLLHDIGKPPVGFESDSASFENRAQSGVKITREICRRLKLSNEETKRITDLVSTHVEFLKEKEMPESSLRRIFRRPGFVDHLELFQAHCLSYKLPLDAYFKYLDRINGYEQVPETPPFVTGDDLIAMGYSPGPIFSRILRTIEDLQLDGVLRSRAEALEHVRTAFPASSENQP
jgi:tRNA nucleotidyltransferase (CCA-adding enzyme)